MPVANVSSDWVSGSLVFSGTDTKSVFQVGKFVSADVGSGWVISSDRTKAVYVCADDGASAHTAGMYRASESRLLINNAITSGNISIYGHANHLKINASVATSAWLGGAYGYCEVVAGKTVSNAAGVVGAYELPATAVQAANTVGAAFTAVSTSVGGTHTGQVAVMHVSTPVAGTWDAAFSFDSATTTGALAVKSTALSGLSASHRILVNIAGTVGYIPVLTTWA